MRSAHLLRQQCKTPQLGAQMKEACAQQGLVRLYCAKTLLKWRAKGGKAQSYWLCLNWCTGYLRRASKQATAPSWVAASRCGRHQRSSQGERLGGGFRFTGVRAGSRLGSYPTSHAGSSTRPRPSMPSSSDPIRRDSEREHQPMPIITDRGG